MIGYKQKEQLGRTKFSLLFLCTFSRTLKNPSNQLNMPVSVLGLNETLQTGITENTQMEVQSTVIYFAYWATEDLSYLQFTSSLPDYAVYPFKSRNRTLNVFIQSSVH